MININTNNTNNDFRQDTKFKNIVVFSFLNLVYLLSLFVISQPNSSITASNYNCTNVNFTDIDYNISIACNCVDEVKYINDVRIIYNVIGIIIMFAIIFTCTSIYYQYINIACVLYYMILLIIIIFVQSKVGNFSSFCFVGLKKYNIIFMVNYMSAFWFVVLVTGIFTIEILYYCIFRSNILLCSFLVTRPIINTNNTNSIYNTYRINTQDTLPLYTEHPTYSTKPPRYE